MAGMRSVDSVSVLGLRDLQRELRRLDEPHLIDELKDANQQVAELVAARARLRARALGGMEAKAAESLTARRGQRAAEVSLGGAKARFAMGAEFGAYRNKLRLRKNTGGRAYIVRDESDKAIRKAIARIEAQTRDDHETVKARRRTVGATPVAVTGRVRGWNQFRPWRGNGEGAGYFLFPAIRQAGPEIVDLYGDALERLAAKAFPD